MAEYESGRHSYYPQSETALQTINTIIQLHFEKTLEKKRAVDQQKKELWNLFQLLFLFLALVFGAQVQSPGLKCHHCWIPIGLLSLSHLIFYVSVAQTLPCINGFRYQRRCHKLTLGLATKRLRQMSMAGGGNVSGEEVEIHYQEPPQTYFGKFKRNWALHFGFLVLIYMFMGSSSIVVLCF